MSNITTYLEQQVQDWAFSGDNMPDAPDNVYIALHDGDPGNGGDSNEIDPTDYDRYQTSPGDWDVVSIGGPTVVENDSQFNFGEADNNWGTLTHISIWDSITGGNALWQGPLESSKEVTEGDEMLFRAGDISIELD